MKDVLIALKLNVKTVVKMPILTAYPIRVDDIFYDPNLEEFYYNALMEEYTSSGYSRKSVLRGINKDAGGVNSFCSWEETFMITEFITLLARMAVDLTNSSCEDTQLANLKDNPVIVCIRKTFLCRFKGSMAIDKLLDNLIATAQVNINSYIDEDGVFNFLPENGDDCSLYILES